MTDDDVALPHDQALALVRELLSPGPDEARVELRGMGDPGKRRALARELGRLAADLYLDGKLTL